MKIYIVEWSTYSFNSNVYAQHGSISFNPYTSNQQRKYFINKDVAESFAASIRSAGKLLGNTPTVSITEHEAE